MRFFFASATSVLTVCLTGPCLAHAPFEKALEARFEVKANCYTCHGKTGKGDGKIPPRELAVAGEKIVGGPPRREAEAETETDGKDPEDTFHTAIGEKDETLS